MSVSRSLPQGAVDTNSDSGAAAASVAVGVGDRRADSDAGSLGLGVARGVQQVFRMEFLATVEALDCFIDLYKATEDDGRRMKVTVNSSLLEGYGRFDELVEVMSVRFGFGDKVVINYSDINTEITVPEWVSDVIADNVGNQGILILSKSVKSVILDDVSGRIDFGEGSELECLTMDDYLSEETLVVPVTVKMLRMKEVKGPIDLSLATSLELFFATVVGEGVVLTFSSSLKNFNDSKGLQIYGAVDLRASSFDEIMIRAIVESSHVFPSGKLRFSGEESPALPVRGPRSLGRKKSSRETLKD